jgi:hypothetical protein
MRSDTHEDIFDRRCVERNRLGSGVDWLCEFNHWYLIGIGLVFMGIQPSPDFGDLKQE